jgi:tight adherence protein C
MDLTLSIVILAVLLFVTFLGGGYALSIRTLDLKKRVDTSPVKAKAGKVDWRSYVESCERVFRSLGETLPRSPEDTSRQQQRLAQAGIRRKDATVILYGIQVGMVLILLIGFGLTGYLQQNLFLYVILSLFLGALLPDSGLRWRIRKRKDRIQRALPDSVDLLVVCVEAGIGLDQALMRIGQENRKTYPDLSDELHRLNIEVNAGQTRVQAMRNLAHRTGVADLKALVAVLIQTERFGTSVAQALRVFSDTLRTKRRQYAEEQAAKMAVKMIPPLVLFVFPSIFVVVAGPAVIRISQELLPLLSGAAG